MMLQTENGRLYFEIIGDGAPLVFVSGWAMSCECWRPVVERLEDRFRCLIYDARGTGRSQPVADGAGFEIEDHAADLHRLIEATHFYDATLIGHEVGSLISALCADQHPQDAGALVMVNPRAGLSDDEIKKFAVLTPTTLALRELAQFPIIRNLVAWRFRRAPEPYREKLFEDFAEVDPRAAYQTAVAAANFDTQYGLGELLEQVNLPVLLVCGDKDKKGVEQARTLFTEIRTGKLATLRDCGFLPMLEYPRQFARLLVNFVATSQPVARQSLKRL